MTAGNEIPGGFVAPFYVETDAGGEVTIYDAGDTALTTFNTYTQTPLEDEKGLAEELRQAEAAARFIAAALNTAAGTPARPAPWDDFKAAFSINDAGALWDATEAGRVVFPEGWQLVETDNAGASCVALFRCDHFPTIEEADAIKAALRAF